MGQLHTELEVFSHIYLVIQASDSSTMPLWDSKLLVVCSILPKFM